MISHHTALIYTMVLVSASDRRMPDAELRKIGEIIGGLPVFADYNKDLSFASQASAFAVDCVLRSARLPAAARRSSPCCPQWNG